MGDGGGLAMNDGITTCIMVLRSVLQHYETHHLIRLDDEDLYHQIHSYAEALGAHFGKFAETDRKMFRDLRGVQGQTRRWRKCQEAIRVSIPSFKPEGLDRYLDEEAAETNTRGKVVIESIEKMLQKIVLDELRSEMPDGEDWWILGVPKPVRQRVTQKYEEDDHLRGGYEFYFELIDYSKIAQHNWQIFQPILGYGTGSKEKQLSWLNFVNLKRNMVYHASSAKSLTIEELSQLEQYEEWLSNRKGDVADEVALSAPVDAS
jgi:DNA sulfur modification protein DndB